MPKPLAKSAAVKTIAAKSSTTKSAPSTEAPKTADPETAPASPPTPILPARTTGLSPKQQKLQAMLAKAAHKSSGAKPAPGASAQSFSAKSTGGFKKTAFQRKAT